MGLVADLALVFVAGLATALATGLGALPFFVVDDVSDRWNVALWGLASGIMVSASVFGLVNEGLAYGTPAELGVGILAGVALVVAANRVITSLDVGGSDGHDGEGSHDDPGDHHSRDGGDSGGHSHGSGDSGDHHSRGSGDSGGHSHDHHVDVEAFAEADLKRLALILGVLTVHSFPEGVAVGVSFAELGFEGGVPVLGFSVPVLAVFMTVAISVHNVPEGLAISIPLRAMNVSRWRMVGAAVFSSLPQPIGAVVAFAFVRWAREFMPMGFGFAAGAMVYLVLTEFIPEALEAGEPLPNHGYGELAVGLAAGVAVMAPLAYV